MVEVSADDLVRPNQFPRAIERSRGRAAGHKPDCDASPDQRIEEWLASSVATVRRRPGPANPDVAHVVM